jgi:hypothetical protein
MHLLIPYIKLSHMDPLFSEYTYGDGGSRARKLKMDLNKGDYIFFHTSIHCKKSITAYYIVDRVLDTVEACRDRAIKDKYKNPHIIEYLSLKNINDLDDNAIVFGDPITSRILERPLLFDRKLANQLSLNIKFQPNKTETQAIGSATRSWRELSDRDVRILLKAINSEQNRIRPKAFRSSEEVAETLEKDIEYYISHNPTLIGKRLHLAHQQKFIGEGRLDVLFENEKGNWVVVELKLGHIGRNAIQQIKAYIDDLHKETDKSISGVIVCAGVMPAYQDELRKQKDIKILIYGWDLKVHPF